MKKPKTMKSKDFMRRAIELSARGMLSGEGGPFGAVIVRRGKIIGEGYNMVVGALDPTAHAEMVAITNACRKINSFSLRNCDIYTSCEPCPMCLGAIYWARIKKVYCAALSPDASAIGFDDNRLYSEFHRNFRSGIIKFEMLMRSDALVVLKEWKEKADKVLY